MIVINWPLFFKQLLFLELLHCCNWELHYQICLYELLRPNLYLEINSFSSCLRLIVCKTQEIMITLKLVKESLHNVQNFSHHKPADWKTEVVAIVSRYLMLFLSFSGMLLRKLVGVMHEPTGLQVLSSADVSCWPNKMPWNAAQSTNILKCLIL